MSHYEKLKRMIDDMTIKEASFEFNDGELTSDKLNRAAFVCGAKWMQEEFLKDLWHPASKEPKFGKGRLLVLINGGVSILNVGFVLDQLRNLHNIYGIEGWLYLDDLLPKEGGEK